MPKVRAKKAEKIDRKKSLNFPPRRIPKNVLRRTLEIVNNPSDEFWLNKSSSCKVPINYESNDLKQSDSAKKLNIARRCFMTRDWKNLAKLLTSNLIGNTSVQKNTFHIFSEYASILLTLENPTLLEKLQQTMTANQTPAYNKTKIKKPALSDDSIQQKVAENI